MSDVKSILSFCILFTRLPEFIIHAMKKPALLFILLPVALIGWIIFSATFLKPEGIDKQEAPQTGFTAPDFSLPALDGGSGFNLHENRGKVMVVNFWASWCPPCRAEMPDMQQVQALYSQDEVLIIPVNVLTQDNLNEVVRFVDQIDFSLPVYLDEKGEVNRTYRISAMPTTFFIDKDLKIAKVVSGGPLSQSFLTNEIDQLLKAK